MRELYSQVSDLISGINFDVIWNGFKPFKFALYNETEVYLKDTVIPYDRRFVGNTAIKYNDEYIAIWKIDDVTEEDSQELTSNIIHEIFHAFQLENKEERFPNDLVMLDYPKNLDNYQLRYLENKILVEAYTSKNMNEKKKLLAQFASLRKQRESIIGSIIEHEYYSETIEGMAEYVGCSALKQMSLDKFNKKVNGYIEKLTLLDDSIFDIRRSLYYSGVVLLLTVSEVGINFYHKFESEKTSLYSLIFKHIFDEVTIEEYENVEVVKLYENHISMRKKKVEDFLDSHKETIDFEGSICGYDPVNMVRENNMILCSHFVMLCNESSSNPLFLEGPVLVYPKDDSHRDVYAYVC